MSTSPRRSVTIRLLFAAAGLVAVALVAAPWLLRDRLLEAFRSELDRQLDATITFDGVSVGLFRHFPHATLEVRGLAVTGEGAFEGVPLAEIDALSLTVDVLSVVRGDRMEIQRLAVTRPRVRVVFDEEGRSNLDVFPETTEAGDEGSGEEAASAWSLALKEYGIEDLVLDFEDRASGLRLRLDDLDHRGTAVVEASGAVRATTRTDVAAVDLAQGGVELLRQVAVGWDLGFELDASGTRVRLLDNRLRLADLELAATGEVRFDEAVGLDLEVSAPGARIESLLSLVPVAWAGSLDALRSEGDIRLGGSIRGAWTEDAWPALDLALHVGDASFGWPDLPRFERVAVDARVKHPGGNPDALVLEVPSFGLAVDGQPLQGTFRAAHPFSDPDVAVDLRGRVDLDRLRRAVPALELDASGRVDLDLSLAGRVSHFVASRIDDVRAEGSVRMTEVVWRSPEAPEPVHVDSLVLAVRPEAVDLSEARVRVGRSDLAGTGRVEGLPGWLLGEGALVGRAELTSTRLDLDELGGEPAETAPSGSDDVQGYAVFVVPSDVDLALGVDMAQVVYGGRTYDNVRGELAARDGRLLIEDLRLGLFGAEVALEGEYVAPTADAADVRLRVGVRDLGLPEVMRSFETLRLVAPVAERATGRLGTDILVKLRLGPDLTPDLASLLSEGELQLRGVTLQPVVLQQVAQKLGDDRFRAVDLADSVLRYQVDEGRLRLDPTSLTLGGVKGTMSGSTGVLDRTLDLRLDLVVPTKALQGSSLAAGLVGEQVPVVVRIGGTHDAPKVQVDLSDVVGGAVDTLKAEVREGIRKGVGALVDSPRVQEARRRAEALVSEAQQKAAALLAEAATKAAGLRSAAQAQADALVAEAKTPIARQAAKKAGDKLVADADAAARKLEQEAKRAGDQLLRAAQAQGEELVSKAREVP